MVLRFKIGRLSKPKPVPAPEGTLTDIVGKMEINEETQTPASDLPPLASSGLIDHGKASTDSRPPQLSKRPNIQPLIDHGKAEKTHNSTPPVASKKANTNNLIDFGKV